MKKRMTSAIEELYEKHASKYDYKQFKAGYAVEKEHADVTKGDPVKTAKIVIAHLKEVPDYYTKLKKVEKK